MAKLVKTSCVICDECLPAVVDRDREYNSKCNYKLSQLESKALCKVLRLPVFPFDFQFCQAFFCKDCKTYIKKSNVIFDQIESLNLHLTQIRSVMQNKLAKFATVLHSHTSVPPNLEEVSIRDRPVNDNSFRWEIRKQVFDSLQATARKEVSFDYEGDRSVFETISVRGQKGHRHMTDCLGKTEKEMNNSLSPQSMNSDLSQHHPSPDDPDDLSSHQGCPLTKVHASEESSQGSHLSPQVVENQEPASNSETVNLESVESNDIDNAEVGYDSIGSQRSPDNSEHENIQILLISESHDEDTNERLRLNSSSASEKCAGQSTPIEERVDNKKFDCGNVDKHCQTEEPLDKLEYELSQNEQKGSTTESIQHRLNTTEQENFVPPSNGSGTGIVVDDDESQGSIIISDGDDHDVVPPNEKEHVSIQDTQMVSLNESQKSSPCDNQVVSPHDNQVVSPHENQVVSPHENQVVSTNENQAVSTNENQVVSTKENKVASPQGNKVVSTNENQVASPHENEEVSTKENQVVSPNDNQVVSPHENEEVSPHENEKMSHHEKQVVSPHENQVVSPHENQVVSPHENQVVSSHENQFVSSHENQVGSPHENEVSLHKNQVSLHENQDSPHENEVSTNEVDSPHDNRVQSYEEDSSSRREINIQCSLDFSALTECDNENGPVASLLLPGIDFTAMNENQNDPSCAISSSRMLSEMGFTTQEVHVSIENNSMVFSVPSTVISNLSSEAASSLSKLELPITSVNEVNAIPAELDFSSFPATDDMSTTTVEVSTSGMPEIHFSQISVDNDSLENLQSHGIEMCSFVTPVIPMGPSSDIQSPTNGISSPSEIHHHMERNISDISKGMPELIPVSPVATGSISSESDMEPPRLFNEKLMDSSKFLPGHGPGDICYFPASYVAAYTISKHGTTEVPNIFKETRTEVRFPAVHPGSPTSSVSSAASTIIGSSPSNSDHPRINKEDTGKFPVILLPGSQIILPSKQRSPPKPKNSPPKNPAWKPATIVKEVTPTVSPTVKQTEPVSAVAVSSTISLPTVTQSSKKIPGAVNELGYPKPTFRAGLSPKNKTLITKASLKSHPEPPTNIEESTFNLTVSGTSETLSVPLPALPFEFSFSEALPVISKEVTNEDISPDKPIAVKSAPVPVKEKSKPLAFAKPGPHSKKYPPKPLVSKTYSPIVEESDDEISIVAEYCPNPAASTFARKLEMEKARLKAKAGPNSKGYQIIKHTPGCKRNSTVLNIGMDSPLSGPKVRTNKIMSIKDHSALKRKEQLHVRSLTPREEPRKIHEEGSPPNKKAKRSVEIPGPSRTVQSPEKGSSSSPSPTRNQLRTDKSNSVSPLKNTLKPDRKNKSSPSKKKPKSGKPSKSNYFSDYSISDNTDSSSVNSPPPNYPFTEKDVSSPDISEIGNVKSKRKRAATTGRSKSKTKAKAPAKKEKTPRKRSKVTTSQPAKKKSEEKATPKTSLRPQRTSVRNIQKTAAKNSASDVPEIDTSLHVPEVASSLNVPEIATSLNVSEIATSLSVPENPTPLNTEVPAPLNTPEVPLPPNLPVIAASPELKKFSVLLARLDLGSLTCPEGTLIDGCMVKVNQASLPKSTKRANVDEESTVTTGDVAVNGTQTQSGENVGSCNLTDSVTASAATADSIKSILNDAEPQSQLQPNDKNEHLTEGANNNDAQSTVKSKSHKKSSKKSRSISIDRQPISERQQIKKLLRPVSPPVSEVVEPEPSTSPPCGNDNGVPLEVEESTLTINVPSPTTKPNSTKRPIKIKISKKRLSDGTEEVAVTGLRKSVDEIPEEDGAPAGSISEVRRPSKSENRPSKVPMEVTGAKKEVGQTSSGRKIIKYSYD